MNMQSITLRFMLLITLLVSGYPTRVATGVMPPLQCDEGHARLDIAPVPQHRDYWCWAATTEMIAEYKAFGVYPANANETNQNTLVQKLHGPDPECPPNPSAPGFSGCTEPTKCDPANCANCNCNCWGANYGAKSSLEMICIWRKLPHTFTFTVAGSLAWDVLTDTLACQQSPIQAIRIANGGGRHALVIVGFGILENPRYAEIVEFWDPFPGSCYNNNGTCQDRSDGSGEYRLAPYAIAESNVYGRNYLWNWNEMFYNFSPSVGALWEKGENTLISSKFPREQTLITRTVGLVN